MQSHRNSTSSDPLEESAQRNRTGSHDLYGSELSLPTLLFSTSPRATRARRNSLPASITRVAEILDTSVGIAPTVPTSIHLQTDNCIVAWMIPYVEDDSNNASLPLRLTRLPLDYCDSVYDLCKVLGIAIGVRLSTNPFIPSNRRYSLCDESGRPIATPKYPPIGSKTNQTNLLFGHIARSSELQEKPAAKMDNNIPGALPCSDEVKEDLALTDYLQRNLSVYIRSAYRYQNLVCWQELVNEYVDPHHVSGKMVPKYFIQEALHIYWILTKIANDHSKPDNDKNGYKFISASNRHLKFSFNGMIFKIRLDRLIPHFAHDVTREQVFFSLQDFSNYIDSLQIRGYHAALFRCTRENLEIPEMVWCGINGHITGDADAQFFGKRFDMPRIAYAIFEGSKKSDHSKFMIGLDLLRARIISPTKEIFEKYVTRKKINLLHYLSLDEITSHVYTNYADPNEPERYQYYQEVFLPMLEKTILRYRNFPEDLDLVCSSDLYSLVIQVAMNHPLSIHAPEDTNLHPGEVGATLFSYNDDMFVTQNEATLLAAFFSNRNLLAKQVISFNPYYLRDRHGPSDALVMQWLDVLKIRCLHAAKQSDFEFRMHWDNINRVFMHDNVHGAIAVTKVNIALEEISQLLASAQNDAERDLLIEQELNRIYHSHREIVQALEKQLFDTTIAEEKALEQMIMPLMSAHATQCSNVTS